MNASLRQDLPPFSALLEEAQIDLSQMNIYHQICLKTDGTLTEILETFLGEKIRLEKISEETLSLSQEMTVLGLEKGTEVIDRKVLLQGVKSKRNWVYAESTIVPDRLDPEFRNGLMHSNTTIGRLWIQHKLETFKEIVAVSRHNAGALADYFGISKEDQLLSRTYLVYSNRVPIMSITEKLPEVKASGKDAV